MLYSIRCFTICVGLLALFIPHKAGYCADATPTDPNRIYHLELTGLILDFDDNILDETTVNIYRDSALFLSTKSKRNGKCNFKLPLDYQYTVIFSKEGYVSKKIIIDTKIPFGKRAEYKLAYKLFLFAKVNGVDTTIFNDPVAYIIFNQLYCFNYDDKHTRILNREAEKLYKEYYSLEARSRSKASKNKSKTRNF